MQLFNRVLTRIGFHLAASRLKAMLEETDDLDNRRAIEGDLDGLDRIHSELWRY